MNSQKKKKEPSVFPLKGEELIKEELFQNTVEKHVGILD